MILSNWREAADAIKFGRIVVDTHCNVVLVPDVKVIEMEVNDVPITTFEYAKIELMGGRAVMIIGLKDAWDWGVA